jgi:hypothetical protein
VVQRQRIDTQAVTKRYESNVYEKSIEAIQNEILPSLIPDLNAPAFFIGNNEVFRAKYQKEGKIKFPFYGIKIISTEDSGTYNQKATERLGVNGPRSEDGSFFYKYHMWNVNVQMEISFVTDNIQHMIKFTKAIYTRRTALHFSLNHFGQEFKCSFTPNAQLTHPDKGYEDYGDIYPMVAQFTLVTWIGYTEKVPVIREIILQPVITGPGTDSSGSPTVILTNTPETMTVNVSQEPTQLEDDTN